MVFCFSGTGNSRYIANRIATALQDEVVDLNARIKASDHSPVRVDGAVVVVSPTYAWRLPRIVTDWLLETELSGARRVWYVMDCGGEIGDADRYNRRVSTSSEKGASSRYLGAFWQSRCQQAMPAS